MTLIFFFLRNACDVFIVVVKIKTAFEFFANGTPQGSFFKKTSVFISLFLLNVKKNPKKSVRGKKCS